MSSYDAGRIFVKALSKLKGKWDKNKLMRIMRNISVLSPRHGKKLKFDQFGDPINPEYIFVTEKKQNKLINRRVGKIPDININNYIK